jgi:hypothetical protein
VDTEAGETCDPEAVTPCECETTLFACARQVDLKPSCEERFVSEYDAYEICMEEQSAALPNVNFTGPLFITFYASIPLLTTLMLLWCVWNQKVSPISGSTCSLERVDTGVDTDSSRSSHGALKRLNDSIHSESAHPSDFHRLGDPGPPMTQTGYKTNFIGLVLYYLIILMNLVVQFLLLALTVEYCKLFCVCVS